MNQLLDVLLKFIATLMVHLIQVSIKFVFPYLEPFWDFWFLSLRDPTISAPTIHKPTENQFAKSNCCCEGRNLKKTSKREFHRRLKFRNLKQSQWITGTALNWRYLYCFQFLCPTIWNVRSRSVVYIIYVIISQLVRPTLGNYLLQGHLLFIKCSVMNCCL